MAKIKLIKGLSYCGGPKGNVITVRAKNPVVDVPDKCVKSFLATGYFVACDDVSVSSNTNAEALAENDADEAVALDGQMDTEALAEMNINELKAFAKEHGISLEGLTKKAEILNAISVAFGGSQTILDMQD